MDTLMKFDSTKHYRTRRGDKVTIHEFVRFNSVGGEVTFPLKCSIRKNKPYARGRFAILTAEGRGSIFREHGDDIVGEWE